MANSAVALLSHFGVHVPVCGFNQGNPTADRALRADDLAWEVGRGTPVLDQAVVRKYFGRSAGPCAGDARTSGGLSVWHRRDPAPPSGRRLSGFGGGQLLAELEDRL